MVHPSFSDLTISVSSYLNVLCEQIPSRMVGTRGNRQATDFFEKSVQEFGFDVQKTLFECLEWTDNGTHLAAGNREFQIFTGPFSPGCNLSKSIVPVESFPQLLNADLEDKIVFLSGEIASEQIMPKNFPFYNPDHHQKIVKLLEEKNPAAIIAATGEDTAVAGGQYPFPLFEDGDLLIPNAYMKDVDGEELLQNDHKEVQLHINSQRNSSTGYNVVARKGETAENRVVIFAHIDTKYGTPGALDNATGIITLLLLAELLQDCADSPGIELVAMNGEDYYSNPGEQLFIRQNHNSFHNILLGINIDGLGYKNSRSAFSLYATSNELSSKIRNICKKYAQLSEGAQWQQGDHAIFLMNNVPALAFTSDNIMSLLSTIIHTPEDSPDVIEPEYVAKTAMAIHEIFLNLQK